MHCPAIRSSFNYRFAIGVKAVWPLGLSLLILLLFPGKIEAQPITASDCNQAHMLCGSNTFQISPNGFGTIMELSPGTVSNPIINPASSNSGCLLMGERNSTWFLIRTYRPGTVEFSFGTPGPVECYDWTMYRYNSNICQQILNNQIAPIRCNWNSPCNSFTGIANLLPPGGMAGNFERPLQAGCEDTFLICFSNYGSIQTSVRFNYFGTALISCNQVASIQANANPSIICVGDSTTLFGSNSLYYNWSPTNTLNYSFGNQVVARPSVTTTYRLTGHNGCRPDTAYTTVTVVDSAVVNIIPTHTSRCDTCDGAIQVNLITPIPPWDYYWSNNMGNSLNYSGLCPGTRYFTYNYNGCMRTLKVCIGAPDTPVVTLTATMETCSLRDGTASVVSITPPGNYTIVWNTSPVQTGLTATGLSVGFYTVTVTNPISRCASSRVVYVPMIRNFETIINSIPTTCPYTNDGQITTSTSGGIPPYQYLWNTTPVQTTQNATGLAQGVYTLQVTDSAGCRRLYQVNVVRGGPVITWNTITPISCMGGSDGRIQMNNNNIIGPYTYSYVWNTQPAISSNTITGLSAGTYSVWVRDHRGCTTTVSIPLHNPPRLGMSVTPTNVSCFGMNNGIAIGVPINAPPVYTVTWNLTPPQINVFQVNNLSPGTYTVSINSRTGCTGIDTFTIIEPPPLLVSATSFPSICNMPNGGITAQATGGTPGYTYLWSHLPAPGAGPPGVGGLTPGTYTVIALDNKNCRDSAQVVVIPILDSLYLSATLHNQTCPTVPNAEIVMSCTGAFQPFTYSLNGGNPVSTNSFSGLSSGTHSIRVYNSRGCYKDTSIFIAFDPVDSPSLIASIQSQQCLTLPNGEISLIGVGNFSPFSFSFNHGITDTIRTFNNLTAGTYAIRVLNNLGCYLDTQLVVPNQVYTMTAQILLTDATCSAGQNGTIRVRGHSPYPSFLYSFNGSAPTSQGAYSNLSPDTYSIRVIDSDGCYLDTSITVGWVPYTHTPTFVQTPPLCFSENNGTIQVDTFGMHFPVQFAWTLPQGHTPITPQVNTSAGTWSVHITDNWNCTYDLNSTLGEPSLLVLSGTGQGPECFGGNNGQIQLSSIGGTSPYQFTWNHQIVSTHMTSLYKGNYRIYSEDANGCKDSIDIELTEPEAGKLQLQSMPSACPGISDGGIVVHFSGGISPYQYYLNHTEYFSPHFTALAPGNYIVTVSDARGCIAEEAIHVGSLVKLDATAKYKNLICHEKPEGEINLSTLSGTPPFTYSCSGYPDQAVPVFSNLSAGIYSVQILDGRGCQWDSIIHISQPEAIQANAFVTPPDCYGDLTGQARLEIEGGTPSYHYLLDQDFFAPSQRINGLGTGMHSITITDAMGCSQQVSFEIPEGPRPNAPRILPDTVCPGETARLIAFANPGEKPVWYNSQDAEEMLFSGEQMNIPEPKRTDTFFVSSIDAKGCESERIPIRIIVAQNPIAGFISDFQTREMPGAVFSFQDKSVAQVPIHDWFWEFGDGEISTNQDPVHEYAVPGSYTVKLSVVDQNGCKATALKSSFVEVQMNVMMVPPNAFSPNGDGSNDYFKLPHYNIAQWTVLIYDRWGNLVYRTNDLNFNWDGTLQGSPAPEAVYTYTVTGSALDQTPVFRSGTVLLMR